VLLAAKASSAEEMSRLPMQSQYDDPVINHLVSDPIQNYRLLHRLTQELTSIEEQVKNLQKGEMRFFYKVQSLGEKHFGWKNNEIK